MSDPIQDIARQLCIQTPTGDGVLAKIRQTIDLLQEAAAQRDQLKAELAALRTTHPAPDADDFGGDSPIAYSVKGSDLMFGTAYEAAKYIGEGAQVTPLYTHPADQVEDDLTMVKVSRELANIAALHLENSGYTETGKKLRALLAKSEGVKK